MPPKIGRKSTAVTKPKVLTSEDVKQVYILVMGSTGSGKSTFINLISQSKLPVSNHLKSCTQEVEPSLSFELDGLSVTLIDTPGFDDTERSDVEVAKSIAAFLEVHYRKGIRLHGALYFHRITDNRLGGISKQSLRLFEELCGDDCLKNVVIVTNMWDRVTQIEGEGREQELKTDERFFQRAVANSARFGRHNNTAESAQQVIRMAASNHPTPLAVQRELVDEHKPFFSTSVGAEINRHLQSMIRKQREEMGNLAGELSEAKRDKDKKAMAELKAETHKTRRALQRYQTEWRGITSDYRQRKRKADQSLNRSKGGESVVKKNGFGLFCIPL